MRVAIFLLAVVAGQTGVTLRRIFRGPRLRGWSMPEERIQNLIRTFLWATEKWGFEWARRMESRAAPPSALAKRLRFEVVGCAGVPAKWCSLADPKKASELSSSDAPDGAKDAGLIGGRVILYLHGGGYCIGSLATCREVVARFAEGCKALVLVPEYRLAPEHPFPAAHDDSLAAYRWLLESGHSASRILLAGDSAGGGLVTGTLLSARDQGLPMPAAAVLFSPWVDPAARDGSMIDNARVDALRQPFLDQCLAGYLPVAGGNGDLDHPLVAPLAADLSGLPPLLIQVGEAEMFLSQDRRIAERAREHGVEVDFRSYPLLFHTFQNQGHELPRCKKAVDEAIAFAQERLG